MGCGLRSWPTPNGGRENYGASFETGTDTLLSDVEPLPRWPEVPGTPTSGA
jgi:hypothetical protein